MENKTTTESRVKKTLLNARVNLVFYFLTLALSNVFFTRDSVVVLFSMTYVIGNQNIVLTICRRKHDCRNKMEFTALSSSLIYGLSSIAILNRLSDSSFDYHKSALNTCSWPVLVIFFAQDGF